MSEYIESELYIIVAVLYAVGVIFKKSSFVKDKWIPVILGIIGIALTLSYELATLPSGENVNAFGIIFKGVTQGILCASGSVYANNIFKQMKKDDEK